MFVERLGSALPPGAKVRLRKALRTAEKALADLLFRHGPAELARGLERLGIRPGDTLLVHSAFRHATGFSGSPRDVVECMVNAVGGGGNLLMVSMPYRSSSYNHLRQDPVFDVRRTMSQMGIVSEVFRRRRGVRRSLHPTHPVLALGKDAEWLLQGHEDAAAPCGPASPFGKFRELGGKVLFYDVPFATFTFIHYIEDLLAGSLPFPIYRSEAVAARVIDEQGRPRVIQTRVFSEEAVSRRDPALLERRLLDQRLLRRARVGRTRLMLVESEDAVRAALDMAAAGACFYRRT
ncbi:MAG: AAC(3) family N-acetyltransferase [Planctomycetes bacterium]|nr:AAC(3) family N-acetyltransferase [Planctomycetota bacterium]